MYKLLIVEDELLIRTGLKHYFNWQELEVHTIVEAENGREGMITALREQPDLIITDIRMPEMDGLQMIEQLRMVLPDTVFIILTGFNEFEFAQKAIKLGGVHSFLLKPLEYEESLATIQECLGRLKRKQLEILDYSDLKKEVKESLKLKAEQLVKQLLEEEHPFVEENMILDLCDFNSTLYIYQPFVLTWLPRMETPTPYTKWMRSHAERFINEAADAMFPHHTHMNRHVFTHLSKTKMFGIAILDAQLENNNSFELEIHLQQQLDYELKMLGKEYHTSLYLVIGTLTDDVTQLHQLLHQTDKLLYQRFYQTEHNLFLASLSGDPMTPTKSTTYIQLDENDKKRIISCLESANEVETLQLMQRLSDDMLSKIEYSSPDKWLAFLQEIISVIIRFANRNNIHIEGVYSEKLLNLSFVNDFPTLKSLFDWLGRWMVHLGIVYTGGLSHSHQQDVIIFEHIESFIREHIDQDVTLQMVADRFFYNPSYLSRLFKRKLDKNYMRFVTEIRIEYAQECLKQPEYLVTDVCTMCGYKSYKHFVKTFRSITNMTPTEYRKQSGW